MYATCKCLNVSIKAKSQLCKVNVDDIDLSTYERADSFFSCELATTKELENIMKEQSGLIETRSVGPWTISRCYNCSMQTHAVHREFGAAMVLINSNLVTSEEEIKELKASPNYSPVFRIVIDHCKVDNLDPLEQPTKFSVSQLPSTLRLALSGLEQQLQEAIQRQARLTDEKIRAYTKEQYNILEEFRERAHNEHSYLTRLICVERQSTNNGAPNSEPQPAVLNNIEQTNNSLPNDVVDTTVNSNSRNFIRQNSPIKPVKGVHVVNGKHDNDAKSTDPIIDDGETMFFLEGMDDIQATNKQLQALDIESDAEDSGNEAPHTPRVPKGGYQSIAKSLPVNVPTFHAFGQHLLYDEDNDQVSLDPIDPHNIQASIKALAKSVHGDTVFGDLPRPRFSTQI